MLVVVGCVGCGFWGGVLFMLCWFAVCCLGFGVCVVVWVGVVGRLDGLVGVSLCGCCYCELVVRCVGLCDWYLLSLDMILLITVVILTLVVGVVVLGGLVLFDVVGVIVLYLCFSGFVVWVCCCGFCFVGCFGFVWVGVLVCLFAFVFYLGLRGLMVCGLGVFRLFVCCVLVCCWTGVVIVSCFVLFLGWVCCSCFGFGWFLGLGLGLCMLFA